MVDSKDDVLKNSLIFKQMVKKEKEKNDPNINYMNHFWNFVGLMSTELQKIEFLFPEYTPHDVKYHINNLIKNADEILGKRIIEKLTFSELFILIISIYGHDWGMTVLEDQKNEIINGKCEINKFKKHLLENDLNPEKINDEDWQNYVRNTHAWRSGERIKKYFEENLNNGIALNAKKVCSGHGEDYETIASSEYPEDSTVERDKFNLKAITIYLRIIDLFDLGEDRTPKKEQKKREFDSEYSRMTWIKHQSLRPIIVKNRRILVSGSTCDHSLYVRIMDFKDRCSSQFEKESDLIERTSNERYHFNISKIDWDIKPDGFIPTVEKYNFDRESMFKILGNEVYKGNKYVFIREMIQNSIDAIELRAAVCKKKGMSFQNTEIKIKILIEGDERVIEFSDNGSGMDEFIIRNYLLIGGKSYYKRKDFKLKGIKIDPVSKFGIGFLTLGIVSEKVEINTKIDPFINRKAEGIKVTVNNFEKYYRVEKNDFQESGTNIRVYLKKDFDLSDKEIADYIKKICGYVKFRITVNTRENNVTIRHPFEKEKLNKDHYIVKNKYVYKDIIIPEDLDRAADILDIIEVDIERDLKMKNMEGVISYIFPRHSILFIDSTVSPQWSQIQNNYLKIHGNKCSRYKIGFINKNSRNKNEHSFKVYRKGILVENVENPKFENFVDSTSPYTVYPNISLNILDSKKFDIDLARSTFISDSENWSDHVLLEFYKKIVTDKENELDLKYSKNIKMVLIKLAEMNLIMQIKETLVWKFWKLKDRWPVLNINSSGEIIVESWSDISNNFSVLSFHIILQTVVENHKLSEYIKKARSVVLSPEKNIFNYWKGSKIVFSPQKNLDHNLFNSIIKTSFTPISLSAICEKITFVSPPQINMPPLIEMKFRKINEEEKRAFNFEVALLKLRKGKELNNIEKDFMFRRDGLLEKYGSLEMHSFRLANTRFDVYDFEGIYEDKFSYGFNIMNYKNETTKTVLKIMAEIIVHFDGECVKNTDFYIINEGLSGFINHMLFGAIKKENYDKYITLIRKLFVSAKEFGIIDEIDRIMPGEKDFIPKSVPFNNEEEARLEKIYKDGVDISKVKDWGEEIR